MRITIDIRLLTRGGTTGIPGYTRDLVDSLINYHPKNQYTLFYNGFNRQPLPEMWRNNKNVSIIEKGVPNRLLDLSFRTFNRPRLESYTPADLIFSPHFNLLPQTTTPRIITFHDLSFLHYPQFFSREQQLWHKLQHYADQAKNAKHIIAVSEFTKHDLVSLLDIPEEKISVVYSGINQSFRKLSPSDPELANYRLTNGLARPFFLYLGSLEPRKNIQLLVQAFSKLKTDEQFKEYQLLIAGKPGYQSEEIKKLIALSPAQADIRILGMISDDERVLLYNLARAFVFPSWFEGFGFPPLEAQACGVPVIGSDRTSLPEILGDSALLTDPWSVKKMTDHMQAIETDTKLRETIVSRGLENAKRFNWHDAATQTNEVFKSTIN